MTTFYLKWNQKFQKPAESETEDFPHDLFNNFCPIGYAIFTNAILKKAHQKLLTEKVCMMLAK